MYSSQRVSEWDEGSNPDYHLRQFVSPYRSTVKFADFLEGKGWLTPGSKAQILDVGAGMGANLAYFARRYPLSKFVGIDINPDLVKEGNRRLESLGITNAHLIEANLYKLVESGLGEFDGLLCMQTLSWLPEHRHAIEAMAAVNAKWMSISSLFYEGEVSCRIEITDHTLAMSDGPYRTFYNVYSLPDLTRTLEEFGYTGVSFIPFEIDCDLPRDPEGRMGTYTQKLEDGRRIQVSGPLLMPWYFLSAQRMVP